MDHVDFQVEQGEVFGLLGPNGAGKTTTQRMLTTLLEPTEGRILIEGHDLAQDPVPIKRRMGLVPEESNFYTELTAWENLMFTARLYLVEPSERAPRARALLETFGLWEKRDVKAEDFSKGMRRRLTIAMAIIYHPALLFLDEPTRGLDAQSTRTIRDLIRELNAQGTIIFLTTHQIEEANQLCDRVAIINHGQIAAIDTPEQLIAAFRKVQSVEVALEPDGQAHGESLKKLPGVAHSVKMGAVARALAYLSPLTYAQDLMNHAVLNRGLLNPWLDVIVLLLGCVVFPRAITLDAWKEPTAGVLTPARRAPGATFVTDIVLTLIYSIVESTSRHREH